MEQSGEERYSGPGSALELHTAAHELANSLIDDGPEQFTEEVREDLQSTIESLIRHAPEESLRGDRLVSLLEAYNDSTSIDTILLTADIRKSTALIENSVDGVEWASLITSFFNAARETVWLYDGFFDKFTGDGFLAYWMLAQDANPGIDADDLFFEWMMDRVRPVCGDVIETFHTIILPDLRANCLRFVTGVGLALGIEFGPTNSSPSLVT